MKVKIKQEILEVFGSEKEIISKIEEYLESNGLFLNHILVDGREVMDNFDIAIKESSEDTVEVVAFTYQEIIAFLKKEFVQTSKTLEERVETLSKKFYGLETSGDSLVELVAVLEDIHIFQKTVEDTVNGQENEWRINNGAFQRLPEVVTLFYQAIDQKDNVYIADLLHFELREILNYITISMEEK